MINKQNLTIALKDKGFSENQIVNSKISSTGTTQTNLITVSIPVFAKDFIRQVLIVELEQVVTISPWLGFISISNGIEFLGKCIDKSYPNDWNILKRSSFNFNDAIEKLNAFEKYRYLLLLDNFNLYKAFRCGLVHACAPNGNISLSHGIEEFANLIEHNGFINFNVDEFYSDFKLACEEVINMDFLPSNKMNNPKVYVNCTVSI